MRRPTPLLAMLLALALTVGGCGQLRLETDDPPTTPASAVETLRQRLATQTAALADSAALAAAAEGSESDLAGVLLAIEDDARTQLDALGGVWRPVGRTLSGPAPRGDAASVLEMLTDAGAATREAALAAEGDDTSLLVGLTLSRMLRAHQLAVALEGEPAAVDETLPSALDAGSAVDLVRTLDALGWVWEIVAARADGDARTTALTTAQTRRDEADTVATLAGLAGTDEDPRSITYDVDVDDPDAAIAALESNLLPCWLAQIPTSTGQDRAHVLDQALLVALDLGLADPDATPPAVLGI